MSTAQRLELRNASRDSANYRLRMVWPTHLNDLRFRHGDLATQQELVERELKVALLLHPHVAIQDAYVINNRGLHRALLDNKKGPALRRAMREQALCLTLRERWHQDNSYVHDFVQLNKLVDRIRNVPELFDEGRKDVELIQAQLDSESLPIWTPQPSQSAPLDAAMSKLLRGSSILPADATPYLERAIEYEERHRTGAFSIAPIIKYLTSDLKRHKQSPEVQACRAISVCSLPLGLGIHPTAAYDDINPRYVLHHERLQLDINVGDIEIVTDSIPTRVLPLKLLGDLTVDDLLDTRSTSVWADYVTALEALNECIVPRLPNDDFAFDVRCELAMQHWSSIYARYLRSLQVYLESVAAMKGAHYKDSPTRIQIAEGIRARAKRDLESGTKVLDWSALVVPVFSSGGLLSAWGDALVSWNPLVARLTVPLAAAAAAGQVRKFVIEHYPGPLRRALRDLDEAPVHDWTLS